MKILVTGSSGTLVDSVINNNSISYELICVDVKKSKNCQHLLDVSNFSEIRELCFNSSPDLIFHFAALSDVDYCESNKLPAIMNNFITTKNLVEIAKELDIPLIFTSTASVFNGESSIPYQEESQPSPCNFYAMTKYLSEGYIKSNLNKYYIFRLGWLVGNPVIDNKFFGNLRKQLKNNSDKLFGVNNQFGSLSFADEFIDFLFKLITTNLFGTYHFASEGIVSRYQVISEILKLKSLSPQILKEVGLEYFTLTAKRPMYEILDVNRIKNLNIKRINNWEEDLKIYIKKYEY